MAPAVGTAKGHGSPALTPKPVLGRQSRADLARVLHSEGHPLRPQRPHQGLRKAKPPLQVSVPNTSADEAWSE